jgi:hypothetical protein
VRHKGFLLVYPRSSWPSWRGQEDRTVAEKPAIQPSWLFAVFSQSKFPPEPRLGAALVQGLALTILDPAVPDFENVVALAAVDAFDAFKAVADGRPGWLIAGLLGAGFVHWRWFIAGQPDQKDLAARAAGDAALPRRGGADDFGFF